METPDRPKVLLLDDDQDLLDVYREILARLPSKPEIHTVTSGARALALLSSAPFSLLICDLQMPKMDGLQVLAIVRRKFPQLRTAVLTCLMDEPLRARAYAMGIDLFLEKPSSSKEITFFLDCVESLVDRRQENGFRGVQSKSLVDIIQLECLSQSSSTLRITQSLVEGRIWIQNGEVIDAVTGDLTGVEGFKAILSWKAGHFEMLPEEPGRTRTIFTSYQGLLLETVQGIDEARGNLVASSSELSAESGSNPAGHKLIELSRFRGVEFIVEVSADNPSQSESWGLDTAEPLAAWTQTLMQGFRAMGERLQAGMLNGIRGRGPMQNIAAATRGEHDLCVGFHRSLPAETVSETMHKILSTWAS